MNQEVESMALKLIHNKYEEVVAVKLDIVDFMLIVNQGKRKNNVFFESILESMDNLMNENQDLEEE